MQSKEAMVHSGNSPTSVDDRLDLAFYGGVYPDLAGLTPAQLDRHWRRVGRREGRIPSLDEAYRTLSDLGFSDFDWVLYRHLNADLASAGLVAEGPLVHHFLVTGRHEEREYRFKGRVIPRSDGTPSERFRDSNSDGWGDLAVRHVGSLDSPVDLVECLLGRQLLDTERQAVSDALAPLSLADRIAWTLGSDEHEELEKHLRSLSVAQFAELVLEFRHGHVPSPQAFDALVTYLDYVAVRRDRMLMQSVVPMVTRGLVQGWDEAVQAQPSSEVDPTVFSVLGSGTVTSWDRLCATEETRRVANVNRVRLEQWPRSGGQHVSVISSLYRPGDLLPSFLQSLAMQSCADEAEYVFVAVCFDAEERRMMRDFASNRPNVVLLEVDERIGIYAAWNMAIQAASGDYLTNANADDVRHERSLEIQSSMLENRPWVDVVYQDVYYTPSPVASWEEIERIGIKTNLPPVTRWSLRGLNAPHNAPMWRRQLHDELGLFDDSLESAGDYDFWMRCAAAGKTFLKSRTAHVAYYVNPQGLSTRGDGVGQREAWIVDRRNRRELTYPKAPAYVTSIDETEGVQLPRADRATTGFLRLLAQHRELEVASDQNRS